MNKKISADMTGCLADPQIELSKALANRNIEDFRCALDVGAKPLATDEHNLSIFEKALQSYGCVEFVQECLKRGCDPNYVNNHYHKSVINYATDSRDPQILKAILAKKGIKVDFKYSELTPLNSLAKNLNPENLNDVAKCIEILLQYGASPNIADQREMTPLHYVAKNHKIDQSKKREIIQMFLSRSDLDIDTYRGGELRTMLKEKYADMKLPVRQEHHNIITHHMLLTHIRNSNMEKFQQQFTDNLRKTTEEENLNLLVESIERGAHLAFDMLMESGIDYNKTLADNTPLEISWVYGNWYALEKLLQQTNIKIRRDDQPLSTIVRKLNENTLVDFCDYWKCFYVLLESDKIDINQLDKSKSTPLHYAVKYRNNKAIQELLKRGADISIKSSFNDLPIDGMSPEILEAHFDSCITSNSAKVGDENYEIYINFRNLIPEKKSSRYVKEVMPPIAFLAKSKDYRHLLKHPVITCLLYLKWHKLSLVFYLNFLLYLFYALSVITHTVLKYRDSEYKSALAITLLFSWLGIGYLTIRECLQFIVCPIRYVTSYTNCIEVALIILSIMTCTDLIKDKELQRNLAVCTILLAAVELCLLVGSLPVSSISTHMLMLEAVCKSFFKSFLLYSIFVITFTLCFYIMLGAKEKENDKVDTKENQNEAAKENDDEAFHKFVNPVISFSKIIVMFTGEFDASSLNLNSYFSYFIFLLFVFFMTIVLFNLLNGLAVSDTQAIQDQAELNYIICRTQLLSRYEQLIIERSRYAKSLVNRQPFRSICNFFMNLSPDSTSATQIAILPNAKNKISLTIPKSCQRKEGALQNAQENADILPLTIEDPERQETTGLRCCFSFVAGNCLRMDNSTVRLAMEILERKSEAKIESRMESMEEKLEKILKHIEGQ